MHARGRGARAYCQCVLKGFRFSFSCNQRLFVSSIITMAAAKVRPKVSEVIVLTEQGAFNWAQLRHPTAHTLLFDIRKKEAYDICHISNSVHIDIELLSKGDPAMIDCLDSSTIERSFTNSVALSKWRNRGQNRIVVIGFFPFSMLEPDSREVAFLYFLMGSCDGARIAYLENGLGKFWNSYPFICEVSSTDSSAAAISGATEQLAASSLLPAPRVSGRPMQEYWPSEIIQSRLWLGNQHNAESLNRLRDLGITHVLNCAGEMLNYWDGETMEMEGAALTYLKLKIQDTTGTSIMPLFDQVWNFLSGALAESHNRVFVHCAFGQSRSASMVISYIMKQFHWPYDASFEFVMRRKEDIKPNPAFVEQLKECLCPPPRLQLFSTASNVPQVRKTAFSNSVAAAAG